MKIVKCGRVYDLDYNAYDVVARLPRGCTRNEVGNAVETTSELRRDKMNGLFYICTGSGSYYSRDRYAVVPMTKDEAAKYAEDLVDYDKYVEFFGDPEGADKGLERERNAALEKAKEAETSKDYWYKEYLKRGDKVTELEKRIAELEEQ